MITKAQINIQLNTIDSLWNYWGEDYALDYIKSLKKNESLSDYEHTRLDIRAIKINASQKHESRLDSVEQEIEIIASLDHSIADSSLLAEISHIKGMLFLRQEKFELAREQINHSISIYQKIDDEKKIHLTWAMGELGALYQIKGEYENALNILNEVYEMRKIRLGDDHPATLYTVNRLGSIHFYMGNYGTSEKYYRKCLEGRKRAISHSHIDYAISVYNHGMILKELGRYGEAEPLILEGIDLYKVGFGEDHYMYAKSLDNLGDLYRLMGFYEKAEKYFRQSIDVRKISVGDQSLEYAGGLYSLGALMILMEEYDEAKSIYNECAKIVELTLGKEHYYYANTLRNLGNIERQLNNLEGAEDLYARCASIIKNALGEEHSYYAKALKELGKVSFDIGKRQKGIDLLKESEQRYSKIFEKYNLLYAEAHHQLTEALIIDEQYEEAKNYAIENGDIKKTIINRGLDHLSEEERMIFQDRIVGDFDLLKNLGLKTNDENIYSSIFDISLFEKGMLLDASNQTRKYILSSEDETNVQYFDEWLSIKKELGKWYKDAEQYKNEISTAEVRIGEIEKIFARSSSHFRNEQRLKSTDLSDLLNMLQPNEVAIEFINFKIMSSDGENQYAALIADGEKNSISFIPLFESSKLESVINATLRDVDYVNRLYSSSSRGLASKEQKTNLYDLIWAPLSEALEDKEVIYYSACGILNRLNLSAISIDEEMVLADRYTMINMLSTRSIGNEYHAVGEEDIYLLGAVSYENEQDRDKDITAMRSADAVDDWQYLRWTEKEINQIEELATDANINIHKVVGNDATEAQFKHIGIKGNSPKIIHLATHGYFLQKENEDTPRTLANLIDQENPMLRSGLIMAGANEKYNSTVDVEDDGILTAYEISNMNLSHTELVVLSACETGLGDIVGTEGVFGLQRAFKMAGAKNIIMSLWQVPDRATKDFMISFYRNYLEEGLTIRKAFNTTQLEMRDRFYDAYNWAGFVLIE